MSFLADKEILRSINTLLGNTLNLLTEDAGLDEHAVTDEVDFVLMKDTTGDDMQHMLEAVELEGVAGIGAALEAGHHIIARSQHVDYLALALVAPLET